MKTRSKAIEKTMEVSNELKSYLQEIIKPLATNKYIEDIVNKMKADIIQIFEDRFKEQEEKNNFS